MADAADSFDFESARNSIERERLSPPLTDEQRKELDRRLAAYKASGEPGMTWEDVEVRLRVAR